APDKKLQRAFAPDIDMQNFDMAQSSFLTFACFCQSFPEALRYNRETGLFEMLLAVDPSLLTKMPPIDNHYAVCCLDRERGMQWIKKERFPFFLQSDCYHEYRCYSSWSEPESLCSFPPLSSSGFSSAHLQSGKPQELKSSQTELGVCSGLSSVSKEKHLKEISSLASHSPEQHLDQRGKRGCGWDKKDQEEGSRATNQEDVPYTCCNDTGFYGSLDKFREFLQGTSGEKLLNLWMDIERLKAARDKERKHRYLVLMRSCYLLSSSQFSLNAELLSRLGLTTSPCWTEDKLRSVQTCLTEPLLHYCSKKGLKDRFYPSIHSLILFRVAGALEPIPAVIGREAGYTLDRSPVCRRVMSSRSQLQCTTMMEKMLQALCAESRAGSYFTHFCEQSGNQLWVNALYFWTDLHYYRELFYQDGLDPYRVQREAQFLYSTYLFSSARRRFGVDEKLRREVYDRLMPPFEELFDRVEEHALNILVEAWTTMVNRDTDALSGQLDSTLSVPLFPSSSPLAASVLQGEQCSSMLSASSITPTHTSDSCYNMKYIWKHHPMDLLLFSIHLMCWLDLEQYRRTPRQHKAIRQERSAWIAARYLNRKYFFGPDSPAMTEQQNDILHLAGGIERLKLECLSNPVVVEIQDVVRNHIEKTWLPLFLSTTEFIERQKRRPEVDILSHFPLQKTPAEGLWMSSTKEILLFRQTLLNPVTCQQFQDFVYSKGGFLENDVLFWLEVQRYKDLCHSHSDDATIQQKVSTIISCFINSSMPPALQIDIPPQQAQHILEKRHELGPYIFREAQVLALHVRVEHLQTFFSCMCASSYSSLPVDVSLSWSYSKYMAGLKREEVLLRRRSQLETTFSTASGTCARAHTAFFSELS
uniref:RGS domain-containing protein n=1 Tax=Maylandia zebra TaxID=106582 RepID=A0A3P9DII3_9CICH